MYNCNHINVSELNKEFKIQNYKNLTNLKRYL